MYKALCKSNNGSVIITAPTKNLLNTQIKQLQCNNSSYKVITTSFIDLSDISKYVTKFI